MTKTRLQTGSEETTITTSPQERSKEGWTYLAIFLVAFLGLVTLRIGALDHPPFWDALWSTSAGAAELSRNGFDYLSLILQPGFLEEGPGTHAPSLLTPILGVLFTLFDPNQGLVAGHLISIAFGAGLATATYALAKRFVPRSVATVTALTLVTLPMVLQQIADPYIEIPVALFTVLAFLAIIDADRLRATLFVFLAVWMKPIGVMLVPLLVIMGNSHDPRRWHKNGVAVLVSILPLSIQFMAPSAVTAAGVEPSIETTIFLLTSAMWTLGSTIDVVLIGALFALGAMRLRRSHPDLIRGTGIVTLGFFGILIFTLIVSQLTTILPRYYVALLPLWLVVAATHLWQNLPRKSVLGVLATIIAFSVLNMEGRFYPLADHPHPIMAERSLGADEYLQLEMSSARALAAEPVDLRIVDRSMLYRFRYPELGFVEETPANFVFAGDMPADLPKRLAWVAEPGQGGALHDHMMEMAERDGWTIERRTLWDGRWRSEIVVASRD